MQVRNVMPKSAIVLFGAAVVGAFVALPIGSAHGQLLPPGARVERLAGGYNYTEGPVYDGMGGLYFSNIFFNGTPSQIIRYDETSGTTEIVDPDSGQANGLFFDQNGQLVSMDMGSERRQVSRRSLDDITVVSEVLASEWNGQRFNSTNDLVIAENGGIYFTDPDYLGRGTQPDAVYHLDPGGELTQIVSGFRRPNGIILSPDQETLYLAVSDARQIMAYDVGPDGLPTNGRLFARTSGGPDGLTVDYLGNVYAAVEKKVSVWDPEGQALVNIGLPERAANVTFGGAAGDTLYITASNSLYGVELDLHAELDIDRLTQQVLAGTNDTRFDLTDDGLVDEADRVYWVKELHNSYFGDSNLDGEFNSGDMTAVFQAGEYEDNIVMNSTWGTGDWNGDAEFESGDFIWAFQDGGYELEARAATIAVPEPSSVAFLLIGILGVCRSRRNATIHR